MQKNKKPYYEAIYIAYLLLNGLSTGLFIGNIRTIAARGLNETTGMDIILTSMAMIFTGSRLLYWHNKKNEKFK